MYIFKNIISLETDKRRGQPCIRGMRITVADILGWLGSGMEIFNRLRIGNGSNQRIADFITKNKVIIKEFLVSTESDYLEISNQFS